MSKSYLIINTPKSCLECPNHCFPVTTDEHLCNANAPRYTGSRKADCSLRPLGKLIDADVLVERIKNHSCVGLLADKINILLQIRSDSIIEIINEMVAESEGEDVN